MTVDGNISLLFTSTSVLSSSLSRGLTSAAMLSKMLFKMIVAADPVSTRKFTKSPPTNPDT